MYRVTPVYATVEPGQSLPLHVSYYIIDLWNETDNTHKVTAKESKHVLQN